MKLATQIAMPEQQHANDPHGFLSIIATMTQAVQRGRDQLKPAKIFVRLVRVGFCKNEIKQDSKNKSQKQPHKRGNQNENTRLDDPCPHQNSRGLCLGQRRANQASNQGM
ncbi:MAG: hypothetical protein ACD_62C00232G0005 [uncultured bacterium]|nr:MAG: hypothetical protein ACD_62C00232G0005 [uncultured bacterium]